MRRLRMRNIYEKRTDDVATIRVFARRLLAHIAASGLLMAAFLLVGILGYHYLAGLGWIDSLLDASMILGGMGPIHPLSTVPAKLFASFYALFSGLVFVLAMGIVLGPLLHRLIHIFHLDTID